MTWIRSYRLTKDYIYIFLWIYLVFWNSLLRAQSLNPEIHTTTLSIAKISINKENIHLEPAFPLFSFLKDTNLVHSSEIHYIKSGDSLIADWESLQIHIKPHEKISNGWKAKIRFVNQGVKQTKIHNVVPLGQNEDHIYLTGLGNHYLSRSHLFIPGRTPVNVILPDNAWELGYASVDFTSSDYNICALARRTAWNNHLATRNRFNTNLKPGGSVEYTIYLEAFHGSWQMGLKKVFQEKMLYDLDRSFDNSMYHRQDLEWIQSAYVSHLMMAWDRWFYDSYTQTYQLENFIQNAKSLYGGDDFIGIWPTWPTLGLDQRNQWDLYRSLPGGLDKLREVSTKSRNSGTKIFISYNPWDKSTRKEDHLAGMGNLIKELDIDGVILDTRGESSVEIQAAADAAKSGVIMYSEGMAIPKNMETILAGRVHNALYYPPILNLNRLINPKFAIFRVAELYQEPILREYNLCLFNGHGVELNIFRPGRPPWIENNYRYLGRVARILRLGSDNFHSVHWIPLLKVEPEQVLANFWPGNDIIQLFTFFNLNPGGIDFSFMPEQNMNPLHYVDLWNYEELLPDALHRISIRMDAFQPQDLGSNNEGSVSAIAGFQPLLKVIEDQSMQLKITAMSGSTIKVWPGSPDYQKQPLIFDSLSLLLNTRLLFSEYFGKLVIELYQGEQLIDLAIWRPSRYDLPTFKSASQKTLLNSNFPDLMRYIPAGTIRPIATQGDAFIPYPLEDTSETINLSPFYLDIHPVTNRQFYNFLRETDYEPEDTTRFLKHWRQRTVPPGLDNHPVVYISYEDALAYCEWAGKRLPTQWEWQYAAQVGDNRKWPWSNQQKVSKEKQTITETLTFERIDGIDSSFCNPGNGTMDPVGSYPLGANPWGIQDLVGSVWQLTADTYDNGSYQFLMLKGGSYYKPESSWWYVQGGPRELTYRQMLLRVSPGFERNATVGFRCVKDVSN